MTPSAVLLRLLGPLGWAFGAASALRRTTYQRGWCAAHEVGAPVVSIGALSCGGSGKTPVAAFVAQRLLRAGLRVGVVHGGYRGAAGTRSVRVQDPQPGAAAWFGDEAVWLARRLPQAVVVRGPDKRAAAELAVTAGAQVVVVDDGFQHLRLARALDLVLLDEEGPSPPLPAGRGREWGSSARMAALRWVHGRSGDAPCLGRAAARWGGDPSRLVSSRYQPEALVDGAGAVCAPVAALSGRRVFVMAGVARPQSFLRLVRACGGDVVGQALARDHGLWSARAWRRASASRADLLLCTEKDLVRAELEAGGREFGRELLALRCGVELLEGEAALDEALRGLVERGVFPDARAPGGVGVRAVAGPLQPGPGAG